MNLRLYYYKFYWKLTKYFMVGVRLEVRLRSKATKARCDIYMRGLRDVTAGRDLRP